MRGNQIHRSVCYLGAALVILLTPIVMVAGFVLLIVATVKGWI